MLYWKTTLFLSPYPLLYTIHIHGTNCTWINGNIFPHTGVIIIQPRSLLVFKFGSNPQLESILTLKVLFIMIAWITPLTWVIHLNHGGQNRNLDIQVAYFFHIEIFRKFLHHWKDARVWNSDKIFILCKKFHPWENPFYSSNYL